MAAVAAPIAAAGAPPLLPVCRLEHMALPVRVYFGRVLSDVELLELCSANDALAVESDADGSITFMSPAGFNSSRIAVTLGSELRLWAGEAGVVGGADAGIRFADGVMRAPDCVWIARERWEGLDPMQRERFLPFCPEFVAEVRSPSDSAAATEAKMEFWMSRGAELGWLIDPLRRLAMVYRPGQEPEMLAAPDEMRGEGPIAGFRLAVAEFWQ